MAIRVRPLGLPEILDLPIFVLREHYRHLLPAAIAGSLAATAPLMNVGTMTAVRPNLPLERPFTLALLNFAMAMISGLIALVVNMALIVALRAALEDRPLSIGQVFRAALRPAWLGTLVVAGLLTGLGMLFCLLPGLLAVVYFALIGPAMVYEDCTWGEAMRRSFELVQFNPGKSPGSSTFLRVAAIFLVILLISYALSSLLSLPVAFAAGYKGFQTIIESGSPTMTSPLVNALSLLAQFLAAFVQALTRLYAAGAFTLLYLSVREAREGWELEFAIDSRPPLGAPAEG